DGDDPLGRPHRPWRDRAVFPACARGEVLWVVLEREVEDADHPRARSPHRQEAVGDVDEVGVVALLRAVTRHMILSQFRIADALDAADLVYCDGYGVRVAARALGVQEPHRMTGADWVWGLASICEAQRISVYLLGSEPGTAREAARRLRRWHPNLEVVGHHHGYFEAETSHNERVLEDVNGRHPNILLVGMGSPKQELWVDQYADRLDVDILWTVGALFDYVSGRVPRAPRWL